jgi:hypothetical protein
MNSLLYRSSFMPGLRKWQLLAVLLLLVGPAALAQSPAWQRALATGGVYSKITSVVTDSNGDVYVAGTFDGTITLNTITLTSVSNNDLFVAKWSPVSGTFVWGQRVATEVAIAYLAVYGTNVYVAGEFYNRTTTIGNVTLSNAGIGGDIFVAKLTDTGSNASFVWAQAANGAQAEQVNGIAANANGVYITGAFPSATLRFGNITLSNTDAQYQSTDGFVAKLTDAGTTGSFTWAQQVGGSSGTGFIYSKAIALSGASIYLAGHFSDARANFGSISLTNSDGSGQTYLSGDAFVAKLTDAGSTGSFVWAQQSTGIGWESASAVAVSGANVYVAGAFSSYSPSFGSTVLTNTFANNTTDVFVAKLTDSGTTSGFAWARGAGGTNSEEATCIAVEGTSVFIAGRFNGNTFTFGSTTLTNTSSQFNNDLFLAKYTDTGSAANYVWAQQANGPSDDIGYGLAVNGTQVYFVGMFYGTMLFDNHAVNEGINPHGFLASLTDAGVVTATAPAAAASLSLAPNPAHGTATLQLPSVTLPATLTLVDALGRNVRTQVLRPNSTTAELDLTGLAPGLYQVRVQAGGQQLRQRLVVE